MNYLYTAHIIQKATQRKCKLPSISPRENQVLKKQDHMIIFHRAIQSNNVMSIMCWFPEIPRTFQDNKKEYLTNSSALEVNLSRKWFIDSKSTSNSTLNLKLVLELKNSHLLLRKTSVKSNLLSPVCLKLDVQVYRWNLHLIWIQKKLSTCLELVIVNRINLKEYYPLLVFWKRKQELLR